ncbi:MAG TPA: hypothetical protein PLK30_28280 [Blastocatellia bacterium]|nr:hypothetical protein [Blastocatellia bacterium]
MHNNYDLKVDGILIGTLNAPVVPDFFSQTYTTATFTPVGGRTENIPNFHWREFSVNSADESKYTFLNGRPRRVISEDMDPVELTVPASPAVPAWEARLVPGPNSREVYELKLGGDLFGYIQPPWSYGVQVPLSEKLLIPAPHNMAIFLTADLRHISPLPVYGLWRDFSVSLQVRYGRFSGGQTYRFLNGHFTEVIGEATKIDRKKDEPTSWEATARVVR